MAEGITARGIWDNPVHPFSKVISRCCHNRMKSLDGFDVVVVGAGPAGSSCARGCATRGLSTLLLERESLPRDKPCGGMMNVTVLERYPDLEDLVSRRTTRTRMFLNNRMFYVYDNPNLLFTRTKLDVYLARKAQRAGADLREGREAVTMEVHDRGVLVTCDDGETFHGRMLVDATGAKSRFFIEHKRRVRERLQYKVVSLVLEAPCPNSVIEERMGFPGGPRDGHYDAHLMTGFIGYGWVFPKDGFMNLGLGTITPRGHLLRGAFDRFLKMTGWDDLDRSFIKAGVIPVALLPQLWLPRVLFVGDAGGFVNPLTGGGLIYGICSGESAAATVRDAVRADDFSGRTLRSYETRCARIKREINLRSTALYYLAGAVKRGLDQPFMVRPLLRALASSFD